MRQLLSYSFLIPPTIFIVVCLVGSLIALVRPRVGAVGALVGAGFLYLFATPLVSMSLIHWLEAQVPLTKSLAGAQAIVVLAGDAQHVSGTDRSETVGLLTLERLATAARLYRRTGLPILVSGGALSGFKVPLGRLMQRALTDDFLAPVKWVEDKSQNTYENASFSARILREDKISTVILVTQDWHMPRALWSFNKVGLHAIPFSHGDTGDEFEASDILPSASAFLKSFYALHEIIGLEYYKLAY